MTTSDPTYSPHSLLPAPEPCTINPPESYFYDNVVKHLVKDTVRITANGLPIDLAKVEDLEAEIDATIADVELKLATNPIMKSYVDSQLSKDLAAYKADQLSKLRQPSYYLVPFDHSKPEHRSYFMHLFATSQSIPLPPATLPTGISKWSARDVQKLSASRPILKRLLAGQLTPAETLPAMQLRAQHKANIFNKSYIDNAANPLANIPATKRKELNIRSPDVKHAIFTGILNHESGKLTEAYEKYERAASRGKQAHPPKNKWSWGRKQLELILPTLTDPDEISLFQCFIDFSFGDKIKTSFIPAFYNYTIEGRLYSNLKLLGAKSARFTSSNPNMLQLPSTGSIYAKAVKKCFIASPGKVILTADFNALEDRVLASITLDEGKCALLEDDTLDGHCYNALGYYPDEVLPYLDPSITDYKDQVRQFAKLVDAKHTALKDIRQRSKAVTFKLAYGGMPDSDKGGAITPAIYDNYHNHLYPGVRSYIDNYVLPTSAEHGKLHLGLGFYIKSDNVAKDARTLHNGSIQFWSLLSILSINEMHRRIDLNNLQDRVKVISSIYDSIYLEVDADPDVIKWTNDNLIECMTADFMPNQRIKNTAESEIGLNWADLHAVPNNASISDIQDILNELS